MPSEPRPRILILGATGGLGRAIWRHFVQHHDVATLGHAELDLERPEGIVRQLSRHSFDVLINAAGMTSPDACETQPEKALLVNASGPRVLAECCEAWERRMIHFSTDYVFSGEPHDGWREEDETGPVNVYGLTKREGELAVLSGSSRALVARVSWLFGPDKASHPDNIIQRALLNDELTAVEDKLSVPTSTADICGWIERIIHDYPETRGVLHLCNSGVASWHSWAEATLGVAERLGLPLKTTKVQAVKLASLTQFQARRPMMTVMSNVKLREILGVDIRNWREALEDYLVKKYQPK